MRGVERGKARGKGEGGMTEQINARSTAMKKMKDRDVNLKEVCRTNGRQPGVILMVAVSDVLLSC